MSGYKRLNMTWMPHLSASCKISCQDLTSGMQLKKLNILKCQAHRKGNCDIIRGNNAADEAAKFASKSQMAILAQLVSLQSVSTPEDIILMW